MSADDPFGDVTTLPKGAGLRIGIVVSRFNRSISGRLLTGARSALAECGVTEEGIDVVHVPGALEIPVVAKSMVESSGVDAVVALGCVIRGETTHYEVVANGAANGIARVAVETGVPVTNGILTTENLSQANSRSGGKRGDAGRNAALAAVEMACLLRRIRPDA